MESERLNQKGIGKRTKREPRMHRYTVKILPAQAWSRLRGSKRRELRGAAVFRAFDIGRCDVGDSAKLRP